MQNLRSLPEFKNKIKLKKKKKRRLPESTAPLFRYSYSWPKEYNLTVNENNSYQLIISQRHWLSIIRHSLIWKALPKTGAKVSPKAARTYTLINLCTHSPYKVKCIALRGLHLSLLPFASGYREQVCQRRTIKCSLTVENNVKIRDKWL